MRHETTPAVTQATFGQVRVIVCGGRDFDDSKRLFGVLTTMHALFGFGVVIHGAARGADMLADKWARERRIAVEPFPARWTQFGNRAGPIRNAEMLKRARPDMVIAFPGGTGTAHMCRIANDRGVKVYEG